MKAVHARITGRVQGVSFRYWTEQEATRLGVAGWVRNEPDGSVELYAEGSADAVEALLAWCRQGPSPAWVRDVAVRDEEPVGAGSFEVRY